MSNHSGGHMLNKVLTILYEAKAFDLLGQETTHKVLRNIVELAEKRYDCNAFEILDRHGSQLGICRQCLGSDQISEHDLCFPCGKENGYSRKELKRKREPDETLYS